MMLPRFARAVATVLPAAGLLLVAQPALAVDKTFTLDRLSVASGPIDGVALWRPDMTNEVTISWRRPARLAKCRTERFAELLQVC